MGRGIGSGFSGGDRFATMMSLLCMVLPALGSALLWNADAHSQPFWAAGLISLAVGACLGKKGPRIRLILFLTAGALFPAALAVALAAAERL